MAVKRYDYIGQGDCEMAPFENGEYVRHADYSALEAECERLREEIKVLNDMSGTWIP
jgi:hypothetical protein